MMIQWFAYRGSIINGNWSKIKFPFPFKSKPWFVQGHLLLNAGGSRYNDNISIRIWDTTNTHLTCYEEGATYPPYYPVFLAIGI